MKSLNVVTKSLLATLIVVLLAGVWVMPTAAAEPPERDYARLEYGLKLALIRADALQDKIDTASAVADVAEEFIAGEQEKGFDTGDLEAALSTFRTQIGEAQTLHDSAAQILDDKAGFNSDGQVVDPRQARDTLKNANRTMQDAGQTLVIARQDFRRAMRDYLQSRRDG